MSQHDHLAAMQLVHRWWCNYDEGHLELCAAMLADDCHLSSRTELGNHPHEAFIRSDNHGRDAAMAWTAQHRAHSPYPLRHNATNVHVVAERGDELDLESYLYVTQIVDRRPSALSSGRVLFTLVRTDDGYRIRRKDVVLDSIESAPFIDVPFVADRSAAW